MLDAIDIVLIHQLLGRYGHLIDASRLGPVRRAVRAGRDDRLPRAARGGSSAPAGTRSSAWFRELDESHPPAHHVTNIVVDDTADPAGSSRRPQQVHRAVHARATTCPSGSTAATTTTWSSRRSIGWRFAHKQCIPSWQLAVVADDDRTGTSTHLLTAAATRSSGRQHRAPDRRRVHPARGTGHHGVEVAQPVRSL